MIRCIAILLAVATAGCGGSGKHRRDPDRDTSPSASAPVWNGIYQMRFAGREGNTCRWVLDATLGPKRKLLKVAFHSRGKRPPVGAVRVARRGKVHVNRPSLSASTPAYVEYKWSVTAASRAFNTGFGRDCSGRFIFEIEADGACKAHGPVFIELRSTR